MKLSFPDFWYQHSAWSQETFGYDQERGPEGPLNHLAKEVQEALAEPNDLLEYADLMLLTFDACRRAGFSVQDLLAACYTKLAINQTRKWATPEPGKPVEHIRE